MRRPWHILIGVTVGLTLSMLVMAFVRPISRPAPPTGAMMGDFGGPIRAMVMQYVRGSDFVWPVYRQFLHHQPAEVTVYMVCLEAADFDEIRREVGQVRCAIVPVLVHHEMTSWSRDRWVPLLPTSQQDRVTLLAPQGESQQEIWPQRAGDSRIAGDLAGAWPGQFTAHRSDLLFDGGDFLADGRFVFVSPGVLSRNIQHTVTDERELLVVLQRELHRQVVLMPDAPDHHAGMFMMSAGDGRMVVADPSLARPLFAPDAASAQALAGGADFSPTTQKRFDAVAAAALSCGYRVTRIPVVPAAEGKMYLTYVNVILDQQAGRRIVYMPTFADQPRLNEAATSVWESLGYQVHPIDCTSVFPRGGTLHCLANVVTRSAN